VPKFFTYTPITITENERVAWVKKYFTNRAEEKAKEEEAD